MYCSRRLYKGNSYEICLPLVDSGVTMVRFYTTGSVIVEKEPEIVEDSMCFSFTEEELAVLPDGVLRMEVVTEYETTDTNTPYVIVTPGDYSGKTIDDITEEAYQSGYTDGQAACEDCTDYYNSGYTEGEAAQKAKLVSTAITENGTYSREDGFSSVTVEVQQTGYTQQDIDNAYASGYTAGYDSGYTDGYNSGYTDGYDSGYTDGMNWCGRDYSSEYFTIQTLAGGNMSIPSRVSGYRVNCGTWIVNTGNTIITVDKGDSVEMKGNNTTCASLFTGSTMPNKYVICGNVLSLFYGDNFTEYDAFPGINNQMRYSFSGCTGLVDASHLIMPETISPSSYQWMFAECTNLVYGPELPAMSLEPFCYAEMFYGCTSLKTAPELPAKTLYSHCYDSMFSGCISLTDAPVLHAEIFDISSCEYMFYGCELLNKIVCLAPSITATDCTKNWVSGVSSTGTFVKACGVEWPTGTNGIPSGWTVEEVGCPTDYSLEYLTVEALEDGDFYVRSLGVGYSVNGGEWITTNLNNRTLALNTGDTVRFKRVSEGNSSYDSTIFSGNTLAFKAYGNAMSLIYGDNFIGNDELPTGATYAFYGLFYICTGLTDASNLILPSSVVPGYNSWGAYSNMFCSCTSLTAAPELPATTLGSGAYRQLFFGSEGVQYIKCLAETFEQDSFQWWIYSETGTLVKKSGVTFPSGAILDTWTVIEI